MKKERDSRSGDTARVGKNAAKESSAKIFPERHTVCSGQRMRLTVSLTPRSMGVK